jgi:thioredoxin reductase (NADPH)
MFTRAELRAVPLFSDLADEQLDYLADTSADIHLLPGEYVVHEGETRRLLFAVIEGRVELTKFADGEERVVGTLRAAGEIFGELPVVLDTPYLVSFRAVQRSRVMRIEAKDFRAVAAVAPKIAEAVGAAALERVEGLQELAKDAPPLLAVIGPKWNNATHELREFLQRNSVEFDWITRDDPAQAVPAVRLRDGTLLHGPTIRDIAKAIGLAVSPERPEYDVAIIGGGPAGLAAAVYGASEGLSTILLEREAPGGQAGTSSRIENYLGFPFGISGDELASRALQQARRLGAEIVVTRTIERIDMSPRTLVLDGGESVRAKTIVLATGVAWRRLDIPSVERLRGSGVYYGAAPGEARTVQGKDVYLVGGGNSAGQAALNFSNFANSVTLLVRADGLEKSMSYYLIEQLKTKSNVRVETQAEVVEAYGDDHLDAIEVANKVTGQTSRRTAAALFVLIGAHAETAWLPPGIERDTRGYVLTGQAVLKSGRWAAQRNPYFLESAVPGIFAVGDVRAGSVKRVAAGVGEGSMAIAFVHQYLSYEAQSA